ncbi:hypothetical protein JARBOU2352_16980 [Enterococcus faecium]
MSRATGYGVINRPYNFCLEKCCHSIHLELFYIPLKVRSLVKNNENIKTSEIKSGHTSVNSSDEIISSRKVNGWKMIQLGEALKNERSFL